MGMRANAFVLPPGTVLTTSGNTTQMPGTDISGLPLNTGISVGEFDILALDFTVTAVTGSITFFYDRLGADGVWYPIYNTPAFTSPGQNSTTLAGQNSASQEFGLKGRLRWTVSGSATISTSIVGK